MPHAPDLGCFVRNEHPFEVDSNFFFWNEYPPWQMINGQPFYIPHQVYARVKCGEAAYYQRIRAWMAPEGTNPLSLLLQPPHHVLGGDHRPTPSDWVRFPVQKGPQYYWFAGEHRPPTQPDWRRDASVGHVFDRYQNGTLSTVGWDDAGGDLDYDDLTMEVAVVYRWHVFESLETITLADAEIERYTRSEFPKVAASPKAAPRSPDYE